MMQLYDQEEIMRAHDRGVARDSGIMNVVVALKGIIISAYVYFFYCVQLPFFFSSGGLSENQQYHHGNTPGVRPKGVYVPGRVKGAFADVLRGASADAQYQ